VTDIVERLRMECDKLDNEAAAEIERLRTVLQIGNARAALEPKPQPPLCPVCACVRDHRRALYPCTHPGCPEARAPVDKIEPWPIGKLVP
jgi:hypothetical protein